MRVTDLLLNTAYGWFRDMVALYPHRYNIDTCIVTVSCGFVRVPL